MMTLKTTAARPAAYGPSTGPASGSPPVLVIDDDPTGAATTQACLAAGYPTAVAPDGDAALRLIRTAAMRLVVAELHVRCAEGPCVVAALKADRARLPRLRVLVHSRHRAPADDAQALAAGADGVLHKPGCPGALMREVQRLAGDDAREPVCEAVRDVAPGHSPDRSPT